MKRLADGLQQKGDNFLLLRFLAAALVIYGHGPKISGGSGPQDVFVWLNWGEYSGDIAVDLFFVISGFLVTGSYLHRSNVFDFLWARFVRIFPALLVCLALCAFVLGPLFTTEPVQAYLKSSAPYRYVTINLSMQRIIWDLPGVFTANPRMRMVNGSLWTLPAEVRMYLWVALLGVTGVIGRRWLFNIVVAALFVYGSMFPDHIPLVPIRAYLRLASLFAAGAFCYVNRDWIPNYGGVLIVLAAAAWLLRSTGSYPYLLGACEVAFVFWFAYNVRWRAFNRFGDYSYGTYLWGCPAQQMVAAIDGTLPTLLNSLVGGGVAVVLAIASWHFVEKPAIRLKGVPHALLRRLRSKDSGSGATSPAETSSPSGSARI